MDTLDDVEERVGRLFALVKQALFTAADGLLNDERVSAQDVVDQDRLIDVLTAETERRVWDLIDSESPPSRELRYLVGLLLVLPELERSADLVEHIAQRGVTGLGKRMTPLSRGLIQRMTEVACEMWEQTALAFADRSAQGVELDEADEELDILHIRLSNEVARGAMDADTGAQVTLLGRFYERLGDHAVNLARRIATWAAAPG